MAFLLHILFAVLSLPFQPGKSNSAEASAPHPFYVSVTEIQQNAAEKTLEVSCKFFADDFEETLEKAYQTHLDIASGKDKAAFDQFIPDYISRHFQLLADGKPVKLSYVGYEKEKEAAYAYFEVQNISSVKQLDAVNSLLHDFKNDQINIMHATVNGKRQSTKLDYPASKASFRF
jgi:hypothetical protein